MSYTQSVLVRWDTQAESDLAGWKVYQGTTTRVYDGSKTVDAGMTLTTSDPAANIPGVGNNILTYVAVTAYDALGNESTFSAEVTVTRVVPLLSVLRQVK